MKNSTEFITVDSLKTDSLAKHVEHKMAYFSRHNIKLFHLLRAVRHFTHLGETQVPSKILESLVLNLHYIRSVLML